MRKSGKPDLRGTLRTVAVPDQRCTAPQRNQARADCVNLSALLRAAPHPGQVAAYLSADARKRGPMAPHDSLRMPATIADRTKSYASFARSNEQGLQSAATHALAAAGPADRDVGRELALA